MHQTQPPFQVKYDGDSKRDGVYCDTARGRILAVTPQLKDVALHTSTSPEVASFGHAATCSALHIASVCWLARPPRAHFPNWPTFSRLSVAAFQGAPASKMPTYNFKTMQVVPPAKDFIDIVLSKTQRGG